MTAEKLLNLNTAVLGFSASAIPTAASLAINPSRITPGRWQAGNCAPDRAAVCCGHQQCSYRRLDTAIRGPHAAGKRQRVGHQGSLFGPARR